MSRWVQQYENHPFRKIWERLLEDLNSVSVDDQSIVTSVQELARLKKVVIFIDEMVSSIDPELIPLSIWDSFNSQATSCSQQIAKFKYGLINSLS